MFSSLVEKAVGSWIASDTIGECDRDIYTYGLDLLLFTLINLIAVLTTALLCGKLPETIILLLAVIPLQVFGGGYHADTHLRCFLIMYIGWWLIWPVIAFLSAVSATGIAVASLVIVFILAPVPNDNVLMSDKQRLKMKNISRAIALTAFIASISLIWFSAFIGAGIIIAAGLGIIALSMLCALAKARFASPHGD